MFSIIVAIGEKNEIGKENKLLWYIPEDLKKFKGITLNKTVAMGRKTYESIGRPLPDRKNIVFTKNSNVEENENIEVYSNLDSFINKYKNSAEEIFIIGGEKIYREFLERDIVEKMYISHINIQCEEADAYFPEIDFNKWEKELEEQHENWKFCIYKKTKGKLVICQR